ncbi:MAG: hypothetical protein MR883_05360 [Clostridiales bacterium]|nr:hypothetical protein [Clostridiales bacterium]MCI7574765.1 hypothetical protein [Clostridiales bacterium]MDY5643246.1 hypothetical protein [Candidatus Faecousia sp.]
MPRTRIFTATAARRIPDRAPPAPRTRRYSQGCCHFWSIPVSVFTVSREVPAIMA